SLYIFHLTSHSTLFFFTEQATTDIYTLSLHDALPIYGRTPRLSELGLPFSLETGYLPSPPQRACGVRPRRAALSARMFPDKDLRRKPHNRDHCLPEASRRAFRGLA